MALTRDQVPERLKWRTEDICATMDEWESIYKDIEESIDFSEFEGKLGDEDKLFECLEKINGINVKLSKIGIYAFLKHDEDTRNADHVALTSRVDSLEMKYAQNTSFIDPEMTSLPAEYLERLSVSERFKDYDYSLRTIMKRKPHILSKEMEELLSMSSKVMSSPGNTFTMLNNADFPFPELLIKGKKEKITHGQYGVLLRSPDRNVRKRVFKAYYKGYMDHINTITSTYSGKVEVDVFSAKARKYSSCLEKAMASEDVDERVYTNLLESVNESLHLLHRYMAVKKKTLGYRELHMYDMYTALVEDAELELEYDDAYELVAKAMAPLGEEYVSVLKKAHDDRWIDVVETEGKRSGAYNIGSAGMPHPFVLLNYNKTTDSIFTIAHEMGHALHSYYSEKHQPVEKASYRIFVAEVASTVNEILLLKYLLDTSDDAKMRKYLLSYYMDMIKGTLFRQTQFAEFEYIAHDMAEKGIPLTKDSLNKAYFELNEKYYGPSVVSDPEIAYEWARIPHFYRNFYVYKYSTGITAAACIAERIYNGEEGMVDKYLKFLSSGGSDNPVELLKIADVDLTKKEAFKTCMDSFENALNEFESIKV